MNNVDRVVLFELVRDHMLDIREALGDTWAEFVGTVQPLLLRVASLSSDEDSSTIADEIFERLLASRAGDLVQRLVLKARNEPEVRRLRGGAMPIEGLSAPEDAGNASASAAADASEWMSSAQDFRYRHVRVFFATDRVQLPNKDPNRCFGGTRGSLTFGEVRVSIPERHRPGQIERPLKWFPESPERHVTLLGLRHSDQPGKFVNKLEAALGRASTPALLVFVHGYRVPFAEAARVAAQLAWDLPFPGVPVLYSWPSKGGYLAYTHDEAAAAWTREDFIKTISLLGSVRIGGAGLQIEPHVLAHSMGNRVVFQGLQFVKDARLGQVILAAPDEDAETLENQLHRLGHAARMTLYASEKDRALGFSKLVHGAERAGQSGVLGIDSIDASAVNFSRFGHSYFHDQQVLLDDIHLLLDKGSPPGERPYIQPAGGGPPWRLVPTSVSE